MEVEPIVIVDYDPAWPEEFKRTGATLRGALKDVAVRIDHIGSTSVPGLAAKPIVDIQISVRDLTPEDPYRQPLSALGFVLHRNNPDLTKRFFREPPEMRRTHVHVRRHGSFDEQLNLLLRDYLRTHPTAAAEYAETKRKLAPEFRNDREGYVHAKEPVVWSLLLRAHDWAQVSGWAPGGSDA